MVSNITPAVIKEETLSNDIVSMWNDQLSKYIKRSLSLVGAYIDITQFTNDADEIEFPDDMIQAVTYIIEYIYVDGGMFWQWANTMKSEKIGDYSYTKWSDRLLSSIDLPYNVQIILDKYRTMWWTTETSIGWYDRDYDDLWILDLNDRRWDTY
jgi:hypothetical protein